MQIQTRTPVLTVSLMRQKINTKNGFRKLNISEALYFKIVRHEYYFMTYPISAGC